MKIFINGRFLTHRVTGVQRYAIEVIKTIDGLAESIYQNFEFIVLYPSRSKINNIKSKYLFFVPVGYFTGHAWEQIDLPFFSRGEILLNLCGTAPLFHGKSVIIIHDATAFAAPDAFNKLTTLWYRLLQPVIAKRAWILGTVSNFSKNEIGRYFRLGAKPIAVLPNGSEHFKGIKPDLNALSKFSLKKLQYVVALASNQPNKNLAQLVRVSPSLSSKFGLRTVIIGGRFAALANIKSYNEDSSSVTFTDYLSDQEVTAIIKNSFCLVYPSKYEGFGIPPIEAMSLEVPVVTTSAASLPEVCGDAALYFSVDDDIGLLENIERLIVNSELRQLLISRGLVHIQKFSWFRTTCNLIKLICEQE